MDIFEQKKCLDSMSVLIDTREQDTDRSRKRYKLIGLPCDRAVLDYGDYTYQFKDPDGRLHFDTSKRVTPEVAIERKMSLAELAQCYTHDRDRFRAEFERAAAAGSKIYLLLENSNFENLCNGRYRSRFHPNAYLASLFAYLARYNCQLIMCKAETSGRLIKEILYRELKERLERGEFG